MRHSSLSVGRLFTLLSGTVALAISLSSVAGADDVKLKATFGIAGRYRPGCWCPVTVSVMNSGTRSIAGQAEVQTIPSPGNPANNLPASCLFARPVSVGASNPLPQNFTLYTRGIDPGHETVAVQIAEGSERGDGRIVGRVTSEPTNSAPVITGTPVGQGDLLLVGFGGDPSAFTFLGGQKMGLAHFPSGALSQNLAQNSAPNRAVYGGGSFMPPTVQVAEAIASDLPDKPAGYEGVDAVLLRSDAPLEALTQAQMAALQGWVTGGGHLVLCGGADPSRFASPFFAQLLPASIGPAQIGVVVPSLGQAAALTLLPKPLPGVSVLLSAPDGQPVIVDGPFGAGQVTVIAYDPTTAPFRAWAGPAETAFWQRTLTGGPRAGAANVLSHVAGREENPNGQYGYYGQSTLSDAVMRAPSLDAPGTAVIGLFLLSYLIILVPINYLVLKRRDKREWAWVTIPALVFLFSAGTFAVGYAAKGGTVFVNRAALVETTAGQSAAGVYSELGLFSPHRTNYDVSLPDPSALSAIPNASGDYRSGNAGDQDESYGQVRLVQSANGAAMQDAAINMWSMRAFDVQATTDLGGAIISTLAQNGSLRGAVTNDTAHNLSDCSLVYHGQWQSLGDIPHGGSAQIAIQSVPGLNSGQQNGLDIPALHHGLDADDPHGDVRQRMQAALLSYARSLGQKQNAYYYNNYGQQPSDCYAPLSNEALLVGWSYDSGLAGPSPRVDGHQVRENDVSLVMVHLPVSAPGGAFAR